MAADNTAELLAELNKALAEGRLTLAEYGVKTKNICEIRAQREADRRTQSPRGAHGGP